MKSRKDGDKRYREKKKAYVTNLLEEVKYLKELNQRLTSKLSIANELIISYKDRKRVK